MTPREEQLLRRVSELEDTIEGLRFDLSTIRAAHEVFTLPGTNLVLRKDVSLIAKILHDRLGRMVTHGGILDALYSLRSPGREPSDDKTLKVQIYHLRKRIKGTAYRVQVVWGHGYMMVCDEALAVAA